MCFFYACYDLGIFIVFLTVGFQFISVCDCENILELLYESSVLLTLDLNEAGFPKYLSSFDVVLL